jgi:UDP-2-acetamido-2-deoxy-ribo-hexuluronate aminotransferase
MIKHFGLDRQYKNLREELLEATDNALREGQLTDGVFAKQFKDWLSIKTKAHYVILCHSGTQALEIIARYERDTSPDQDPYANWEYDKETYRTIRVPNLTYPATMNAFLSAGLKVELADTDRNGLLLPQEEDELQKIECHVGLFGAPTVAVESDNGVGVLNNNIAIVDGAQHWLIADGNIGTAMAISFDPTKNLNASGNGGAIVTNNQALYEFANQWRDNGKPHHFYSGTNSKMSEIDCAHILVRAKYIDEWQERRKEIRQYYIEQFKHIQPLRCLSAGFEIHADSKFVVYAGPERNDLVKWLERKDIETKIHYNIPLSELPIADDMVKPDLMSTSTMLTRSLLTLPMYPELTDAEIETVANAVCTYYAP